MNQSIGLPAEDEKFARVNVSSVLEVAYHQLRESIMAGQFLPGDHVRQEDIARRLGISRGPAREALNRLVAEGMVKLLPRRGYVVESLDPEEVEDIFDLRIMLEERAGYLATKNGSPPISRRSKHCSIKWKV